MDVKDSKAESPPHQVLVFNPHVLDDIDTSRYRVIYRRTVREARLFWSGVFCVILGLCVIFPLGWSPSQVIHGMYDHFNDFHWKLPSQNGDPACSNRSEIVRPLINDKTTFDLVATFWIENSGNWTYSVLHDEVLFKDVRLDSLPLSRTVELDVPVAPKRAVWSRKIRVGYGLIPTDSLTNPLLNPNLNNSGSEIRRFSSRNYTGHPVSDSILKSIEIPQLREFISASGESESLVSWMIRRPSSSYQASTERHLENREIWDSHSFGDRLSPEETDDILGNFTEVNRIVTQSWLMLQLDHQLYNFSNCNTKQAIVEIRSGDCPLGVTYRDGTTSEIRSNRWSYRGPGPFRDLIGLKDLATNVTEWFNPPHLRVSRSAARSKDAVTIWHSREEDGEDSEADGKEASTIKVPWTIYFSLDSCANFTRKEANPSDRQFGDWVESESWS